MNEEQNSKPCPWCLAEGIGIISAGICPRHAKSQAALMAAWICRDSVEQKSC